MGAQQASILTELLARLVIQAVESAQEHWPPSAPRAPYQQSLREITAVAALRVLIQMEQPVQLVIRAARNALELRPPYVLSARFPRF